MARKKYSCTGAVHQVLPIQTFASGFKKQTLILELSDEGAKYQDFGAFDFFKDDVKKLEGLHQGDVVTVDFFISARENPNRPGQWFSSNNGRDIGFVGSGSRTIEPIAPASAPDSVAPEAVDPTTEDLPF